MDNIIISDAAALCSTFQKASQLKDDDYDADLERQIRIALKLPATGQMLDFIKNQAICVEDLLAAILNAMQPFSQMLVDLYQMFEQASAQYNNTNLQIRFNFDANSQPFQFDLDHFRTTISSAITCVQKKRIFMVTNPWSLIYALDAFGCQRSCNRPRPTSAQVCRWLDEYEKDVWPDFMPEAPKTGIKRLDDMVKRLWTMVESTICYYKEVYNPEKGRRASHHEECIRRQNDALWWAETDLWTSHFIWTTACTMDYLNELPQDEKSASAQKLEQVIQEYLKENKMEAGEIRRIVNSLEDVLNLPFWKKRYELYAAWVLVQITEALKDAGLQFHISEGILSFSFHKTLMATCTKLIPPLEIWAELRTESSSMLSKKRKNHIQPDYTLAIGNASDATNTVAVVECKQYKKSNQKNFFEAIFDYANGRPEAKVFLVNYGSVSRKLLDGSAVLQQRAFPFGEVRPGTDGTQRFCHRLKNEVLGYYREKAMGDRIFLYPWKNPGVECLIQLKWKRLPRDLDLHLRISDVDEPIWTVNYASLGNEKKFPYAYLDCDCRSGYGCETIHIVRWLNAEYDVIVDNFSGEMDLEGAIEVSISCGSDQYHCSCTKPWCPPFIWHVFKLNSFGFQIIDSSHQYIDP